MDAWARLVVTVSSNDSSGARLAMKGKPGRRPTFRRERLAGLALNQCQGGCQPSTWLHGIVVNTALMKLLERKQTRATVRACIEQLPENYVRCSY